MVLLELGVKHGLLADRAHADVARAVHAVNREVHLGDLAFAAGRAGGRSALLFVRVYA